MVNEFRGGFFRNRNDSVAVPYFTNAQFGIQNPFAGRGARPHPDHDRRRGRRQRAPLRHARRRHPDLRSADHVDGRKHAVVRPRQALAPRRRRAPAAPHGRRPAGDRNRRHNFDDWFGFLTVGYANPADRNRARQIADSSLNYGETVRNFRMTDWSWFIADDWRGLAVAHVERRRCGTSTSGSRPRRTASSALYDFDAALATGNIQDGFVFASNFDPARCLAPPAWTSASPAVRASCRPTTTTSCRASASRGRRSPDKHVVLRGGYGVFYERMTGAFANSLRQSPPFFREVQLDDLGNWNTIPRDVPMFPVPDMSIAFDDGEPFLVGDNNPDVEFEAFETQMVSTKLVTPYLQQWNATAQWEFRPNWMVEIGYVGSKGSKLLQWANLNQAARYRHDRLPPAPGRSWRRLHRQLLRHRRRRVRESEDAAAGVRRRRRSGRRA